VASSTSFCSRNPTRSTRRNGSPDDPKVRDHHPTRQKIGTSRSFPKRFNSRSRTCIANVGLRFQGKPPRQGNFYGVNIYDISTPENSTLLTFDGLPPGGQGDVLASTQSLFSSCPSNAEWAPGLREPRQGFPSRTSASPPRNKKKRNAAYPRVKKIGWSSGVGGRVIFESGGGGGGGSPDIRSETSCVRGGVLCSPAAARTQGPPTLSRIRTTKDTVYIYVPSHRSSPTGRARRLLR